MNNTFRANIMKFNDIDPESFLENVTYLNKVESDNWLAEYITGKYKKDKSQLYTDISYNMYKAYKDNYINNLARLIIYRAKSIKRRQN